METIRKCIICKKEIKIRVHYRKFFSVDGNKYESTRASDEGVCWYYGNSGCWFCNECWDKVNRKVWR